MSKGIIPKSSDFGHLNFRDLTEQNQLFARAASITFLVKLRTARCAVPLEIPKTSQISPQSDLHCEAW